MNTMMQNEWREYCKRVYPKGMSEQQRKELYQCWFSSALALMLKIIALGKSDECLKDGMDALFTEAKNECHYLMATREQPNNRN